MGTTATTPTTTTVTTIPTITVEDLIINKLESTHGGWGAILNRIQEAAEQVLPMKSLEDYINKAVKDEAASDGTNGVIFNGEYFDWKEFDAKRVQIVKAYMKYFTTGELNMIYRQLKTRRKK